MPNIYNGSLRHEKRQPMEERDQNRNQAHPRRQGGWNSFLPCIISQRKKDERILWIKPRAWTITCQSILFRAIFRATRGCSCAAFWGKGHRNAGFCLPLLGRWGHTLAPFESQVGMSRKGTTAPGSYFDLLDSLQRPQGILSGRPSSQSWLFDSHDFPLRRGKGRWAHFGRSFNCQVHRATTNCDKAADLLLASVYWHLEPYHKVYLVSALDPGGTARLTRAFVGGYRTQQVGMDASRRRPSGRGGHRGR